MSAPLLSVVTVTMNDVDGLVATLGSLVEQGAGPGTLECIVVDGGCSPEVTSLVTGLDGLSVRLISEPDSGVYDAMNKGWRAARGTYVQFLNSGDTLAGPSALAAITRALARRPVWAVFGALHLRGGSGTPVRIGNLPHSWWRHALGLQVHCHQATVVRRDLIDHLGGYSTDFGFVGDFDLILRLGLLSPPLECPAVVVHYLGGGLSARSAGRVAELLGRCREVRFQLSGAGRLLNSAWARYRRLRWRVAALRTRVG